MHRRTYERLCDEHDTFEHAVNLSFIDRFGPMLKKRGFLMGVKMARNRNVNFTPRAAFLPLFCKGLK
jgi:hypothetical protein